MARQKKMGKLAIAMTERQFVGPEPMWSGMATQNQLVHYYNWCSYRFEAKETKEFVISYLEKNGEDTGRLRELPAELFMTLGATARLHDSGRQVPLDVMERFRDKITTLRERSPSVETSTKRATSVANDNNFREACIFADRVFDQLVIHYDYTEEMRKDVDNGIVTKKVADSLIPQYRKELAEIELALSGKDPEIAEGFMHYDRKDLKRLCVGMDDFISHLSVLALKEEPKIKKARKQRISRPKSPDKQIKKLKFARNDDKYKLNSIDPRSIVGAAELWLFNGEYRKLTVLRAADNMQGLSVKGSTICGFDDKNSFSKRVRKPEVILPEIMNGGKVSARKAFEGLKTQLIEAKGRVNADTILMRVFR
jgi:hypothetical protein